MKRALRGVFGVLFLLLAILGFTSALSRVSERETSLGSKETLRSAYELWRSDRESREDAASVDVALGWSKGLSREFTRAHGWAKFDLDSGDVSVELEGLPPSGFDFWLVDNQPGAGRSAAPEPGDDFIRVGSFRSDGSPVHLTRRLDGGELRDFEIDLAVVSPTGRDPGESGLLFGAPTLFERVYARTRQGLASRNDSKRMAATFDGPVLLRAFALPAVEAAPANVDFEALVTKGRDTFFRQTFAGNGRTCGTCHPAANNLTLDPQFIATLAPDDPLFVAETNPDLAQNFEKPELMRQLGLILENVDGFDNLAQKFVLRAVPPTLALPVQTQAPPNIVARIVDGTSNPPRQRTGWGGDGSPGSGTLREFALGAVRQHFTLTLQRQAGKDFRLPTDEELDALEAFQLSLGRQQDLNLGRLQLKGAGPARGQQIFRTLIPVPFLGLAAGKCNACHGNAGARDSIVPGNFVINFNTGVENIPNQPADLIDPTNPPDGGFGTARRGAAFGNGTFSTTPVVESADTAPFFHNNAVATIEDAVRFYSTAAFNNSPAGRLVGGIRLKDNESLLVAQFLRVINALENVRSASAYQTGTVKVGVDFAANLGLAAAELEDAVDVLAAVGLHPDAVALLGEAQSITESAAAETDPAEQKALVARALALQTLARAALVR